MKRDPRRLDAAHYPSKVRILARYADVDPLWHINNVAIFQGGACVSVSDAVLVYAEARGPAPLPEDYRRRLQGWLMPEPAGD
jgi:hypothetical protein